MKPLLVTIAVVLLLPFGAHKVEYTTSVTDSPEVTVAAVATISPIQASVPAVQDEVSPVDVTPPVNVVAGCGDDSNANNIYSLESGCNIAAVNPTNGDCGIGQAGPCTKLSLQCPDWQTDYVCQNSFFDSYMVSRYGTWAAAWAHELAYHWW